MTTMDGPANAGGGRRGARIFQATTAVLAVGVALVSFRYVPRVGPLAPDIVANLHAAPWLTIHAAGGASALLVGWAQFLPALRARRPAVHRWTGRLYMAGCVVAGIAGLPLAFGSTAGPVATAGFGLLAAFWLTTTLLGLRTALERRFAEHRRWMIRSWSLTLAAVTLRLYLPALMLAPLPPTTSYVAISFLCWVPNLLIAECWLRRGARA